ncbi:MAG: SGNH/GDSL hydrolase family protein [Methylococcaceae bacterium]|nr:SGNH/GDSL hydrolase family protein [Methylococcaceae bacterium]
MKTILCFGDSNTWGYIPGTAGRYDYRIRWTGHLQIALGNDFRVIEEGLNGRTTVWDEPFREGRNGRKLLRPLLESHAPVDLLIIALGTNDLKHFYHAAAYDSARGLQTLITVARSSAAGPEGKTPAILVVAPPVMSALSDAMLRQFAGAREKSLYFAEAFSEIARIENCFYLDASKVIECSAIDGIHLDEEAHRNLAGALENQIREIFRE